MQSTKNKDTELAKELCDIGRQKALDMGILHGLPPEVKEVKLDYDSPFTRNSQSHGYVKKILPYKVASVLKVQHPQTEEQIRKYQRAHTYYDCMLVSQSKIGRFDDVDDLHFFGNATIWDAVSFWRIEQGIPISVPFWLIDQINKTCNLRQLSNEDLSPEVIQEQIKNYGICSAGRYVKKPGKQIFKFVEL